VRLDRDGTQQADGESLLSVESARRSPDVQNSYLDRAVRGKFVELDGGRPLIIVRSESRDERTQYTVAHELGEYFAPDVFEQAGEDVGGISAAQIEETAHLFASRLLCPDPWFRDAARRWDEDLPARKSVFDSASHEVIALRMLQLEAASVVTVIDNGAVVRRQANLNAGRYRKLSPTERRLWESCRASGRPQTEQCGGLKFQVWPVWENGFRREILRTSALDVLEG